MRLGLILYDWLGGAGQPVPPHEFFRGSTFARKFSFLDERNIRAGFTYGDCLSDDARFVLEIVDGARKAGAVAVNYAGAEKLLMKKDAACGAVVADAVTGARVEVKARLIVNTAGPWNESLVPGQSQGTMTRLTKGVHLIMPPLPLSHAFLIITEKDNRIFFLIPWYDKTLLGTTDTDYSGSPDKVQVEEADVDYLLGECNRVFNDIRWTRADILGAFAGLRSLRHVEGANPSDVTREWSLETPVEGMLMPVGGKYTSARADAAQIVDKICENLSFRAGENSPTENKAFPWCPPGDFPEWREEMVLACRGLGLEEKTAEWACFRYGSRIEELLKIIRRKPALTNPIVEGLPFCRADIVLTATTEMALNLEDIVRRRIPLILLHPARASFVRKLADEVAQCLEWSKERKNAEIEAVMTGRQAAWLFPE
jgi:glycerol-3-phosphate dehydrogenase